MTDRELLVDAELPASLTLVLAHLPRRGRGAAEAIYALDARLARIASTTTEPVLGQMRLAWWAEALAALDRASPGAEPVLRALASGALPRGITGAALAALVEPWETLLDPYTTIEARAQALADRGRGVLSLVARVLAVEAPGLADAGAAWGLGSALHMARSLEEQRSFEASAAGRLRDAMRPWWPRPARALALPALAVVDRDAGMGASIRLAGFLLLGRSPLSRASRST